jgi:hypothetical protein
MKRTTTKAQRHAIGQALYHLERATKFIMSDRTAVCRRIPQKTTGLDFTRDPVPPALFTERERALGHYALTEINKEIGSDLCGLQDAHRFLESLLS